MNARTNRTACLSSLLTLAFHLSAAAIDQRILIGICYCLCNCVSYPRSRFSRHDRTTLLKQLFAHRNKHTFSRRTSDIHSSVRNCSFLRQHQFSNSFPRLSSNDQQSSERQVCSVFTRHSWSVVWFMHSSLMP
jgi:hypothetical protein